jgi:Protein of unknown function (DUF3562)
MSTPQQSVVGPLHVYAIDALVEETNRPVEEVAQLYMRELARLQVGARIQDYLVLLTSRRVRAALRRSGGPRFLNPTAFGPRDLARFNSSLPDSKPG